MRIWEQVDIVGGEACYAWMLDGVGGRRRVEMRERGWEWLRGVGGRGVYVTRDPMAAWFAIKGLGVKAKSNGTHREAGVPMYDFFASPQNNA